MKERFIWLIMIKLPLRMVVYMNSIWFLVRIFGTEDRKCDVFIDMLKDMRPVISFNRTGIRSINIIPDVGTCFYNHR